MRAIYFGLVVLVANSAGLFAQQTKPSNEKVSFSRQVLPILSDKCFLCHGPDSQDEDLVRLDSFSGATVDLGGYFAIDPDHLEQSEILKRIGSADAPMPPADFPKKLTPDERRILSRWIEQGGQYELHWSFSAPKRSPNSKSVSDQVDHLIHQKLKLNSTDFAAPANPSTLARRAALVLTGLPPEPPILDEYLKDPTDKAFEKLVDQLLDHPRFGEHQARYWLDAVRYGDTHGLHLDNRRGIYPYRDWVVKAFNDNLPLDDFITWQLAGDLLPQPTLPQYVATGFVRMNPSTAEGGAIAAEFQAKNSFDRTENFGTVFLGMSFNCARCHTHKYDPITQTEYYQLLAFFNNTSESALDGNSYTYGNTIRAPSDQVAWREWSEISTAQRQLINRAEQQLEKLNLSEQQLAAWNSASPRSRLEMLADASSPFARLDEFVFSRVIQNSLTKLESSIYDHPDCQRVTQTPRNPPAQAR